MFFSLIAPQNIHSGRLVVSAARERWRRMRMKVNSGLQEEEEEKALGQQPEIRASADKKTR